MNETMVGMLVGLGVGVGEGVGVGLGVGVGVWPIQTVSRETALPMPLTATSVYTLFCVGITVTEV